MDIWSGGRRPSLDRRSLGNAERDVNHRVVGSVLVTGGSGFLGRHLVERLTSAGERVVSYNRDHIESTDADVVPVQGELYDVVRLVRVLGEHAVDRIVHTAAISHPEVSIEMPVATFAANVDGTLHVFEAARMGGVARVVNFSSEAVFGDQPRSLGTAPLGTSGAVWPTTCSGSAKTRTDGGFDHIERPPNG
jgi:nucleoside-diphosphate-sugar epimerase